MIERIKALNLPMGVWQRKITGALQPLDTICSVEYPDIYTARFEIQTPRGNFIARFSFSYLPSCSGIIVSHGLMVHPDFRGMGIAQTLQTLKKEIARDLKASMMLATVNATNAPQKSILDKFGWQTIKSFFNRKTGNNIEIQVIDL